MCLDQQFVFTNVKLFDEVVNYAFYSIECGFQMVHTPQLSFVELTSKMCVCTHSPGARKPCEAYSILRMLCWKGQPFSKLSTDEVLPSTATIIYAVPHLLTLCEKREGKQSYCLVSRRFPRLRYFKGSFETLPDRSLSFRFMHQSGE